MAPHLKRPIPAVLEENQIEKDEVGSSSTFSTSENETDRPRQKPRLDPPRCEESRKPWSLPYPSVTVPTLKQTPFQQPSQLISFSYNSKHVQEFNNSALRYFVEPPIGAKLGYGYERWIRKPDERGRLDGLLKAISAIRNDPTRAPSISDMGVVSWRGVITKILTAPYEERDGWDLNIMFVNGTLYLEEHLTDARLQDKNEMQPRQRLQGYYGYAFESYCTSETPTRQEASTASKDPVGWGGDVDTNIQWCSVVRTKLGDMRMVIGGEVDCVKSKYTGKTDTFMELKTSLVIRGPRDEARFEKKLLKFYFQSFLLGVPEILVGFRTPAGVVTTTQAFKTTRIPRLVRGKPGAWDPLVCLDWGYRFLTFLKDIAQTVALDDDDSPRSVWRARFVPGTGVSVHSLERKDVEEVVNMEERVGFLPSWYWSELQAPQKVPVGPTSIIRPADGRRSPPNVHAGWQL